MRKISKKKLMIILIFLITIVGAGYSIYFSKDVQYSIQIALAKEKIELELIDEAEQYLLTAKKYKPLDSEAQEAYNYVKNEQYSIQITLAKEKIGLELIDEAEKHLLTAKKYKPLDSEAQELYDYVKIAEESITAYNAGEKYFQNKDYLRAAESYNRVDILDVARYELAIQKKKESSDKYFEENAAKEFNQLEQEERYREAITLAKRLLKLNTTNQDELNQKVNYYNQKIEEDKQMIVEQQRIEAERKAQEAERKAKEEAERKAKEEAERKEREEAADRIVAEKEAEKAGKWIVESDNNNIWQAYLYPGVYQFRIEHKGDGNCIVFGGTKQDPNQILIVNELGYGTYTNTFTVEEEGFYILTFKTGSAFSFEYKPF